MQLKVNHLRWFKSIIIVEDIEKKYMVKNAYKKYDRKL